MARVVCDKKPLFSYTVAMTNYKEFAEDLARQAGKIILEYFKIGVARTIKEDTSPLTEADTKINTLVIDEIQKHFPGHSVLAEEGNNLCEGSEYVWVCDPIDGTRMFTHGLPVSTFSLSLVHNGVVQLAVIYDPFCDRLYSAEKGKGTFLNGVPTFVSDATDFNRQVIDCESSTRSKYDIQPLLHYFYEQKAVVLKLNSIIYVSAMVAAGQVVATVFPFTTVHDAAAIKIIVEEAGGRVTDMHGREQRYDQPIDGLLVSNGVLHDELVALAEKFVIERK